MSIPAERVPELTTDRRAGPVSGRAAAALAVSLVLHGLLIYRFPPLALPGAAARPPEPPPAPVVLREAPPTPAEAVPAREVFRPDRAGAVPPPTAPPPDAAADPVRLEPPSPARPLAAEAAPLRVPELPPAPPFEPRIERIEAEQRRVPDEVAALPRRVDAAVDRAPRAPDILPATRLPALVAPALPVLPTPPAAGIGPGPFADGGAPGGVPGGMPDGGWARELERLLERETPSEVTAARSIESLLRLDLRVYRLPSDGTHRYVEIRIRRHSSEGLAVLPKDVLLVQDSSESMTDPILDQCKRGLMTFLQALGPEDRFDVMSFADRPERCFGALQPAGTMNRARAGLFVEALRSRGKTDVLAFLEQVAAHRPAPGRAFIAVLFTDGVPTMGLADNFGIIEQFTGRNAPGNSVFAFGAGNRVNRFLLDMLSYGNRGDSRIAELRSRIPGAVDELARELARPVLTELNVRFTGDVGREFFPRTLTNLYLDRPLVLYGRVPDPAPPAALHIRGRAAGEDLDMVFPLDWDAAAPGEPALVEQWAWQRILTLISAHVRTRDPALLEELQRVGRAYGIRIPYAEELGLQARPPAR